MGRLLVYDRDGHRIRLSSPSYTLTEIEQLVREYCDEWERETESTQTEFRLALSLLFQWAKQREKEGNDD